MTPEGTLAREGWGTFRGRRVNVSAPADPGMLEVIAEADLLDGWNPVPLDATYGYSRSPLAVAAVPAAEVAHVAMTETQTFPASGVSEAEPGLFALVNGRTPVRLSGTTGFVRDGEPRLQLEWAGEGAPDGFDWVRNGETRVAEIARSSVDAVEYRTVRAEWRGHPVEVVRLDGHTALIQAEPSRVPAEAPELAPTDNPRARRSAMVDVGELAASSAQVRRRPLPPAHFPSAIADVDAVMESVGLPDVDGRLEAEPIALVRPSDEPRPGMALYPLSTRGSALTEWRAYLPARAVGTPERVVTEARVDGEWVPVGRINSDSWRVFDRDGQELGLDSIEGFRYMATSADLREMPAVKTRRSYLDAIGA